MEETAAQGEGGAGGREKVWEAAVSRVSHGPLCDHGEPVVPEWRWPPSQEEGGHWGPCLEMGIRTLAPPALSVSLLPRRTGEQCHPLHPFTTMCLPHLSPQQWH